MNTRVVVEGRRRNKNEEGIAMVFALTLISATKSRANRVARDAIDTFVQKYRTLYIECYIDRRELSKNENKILP